MNRSRVTGDLVSQNNIFVDIANDRVGIGSTIPTQKLEVTGTVKATAFVGDGSGLTGVTGSGQISNVVEDTTPQLGGNLDVNGKDIISTSNGDIEFTPNGTGAVVFKGVSSNGGNGAGRFKLNCEVNSHGITIQGPPHSAGANYTLTLPNDDGSSGQFLQTNGSGVLSFATVTTDLVGDTSPQLGGNLASNDNNINIADSTDGSTNRITIGSAGDLQIYHDGSNNILLANSGDLNIRMNSSENAIVARQNGAAELYYNNSKKIETTNTGASVTGAITATSSVTLNNQVILNSNDNSPARIDLYCEVNNAHRVRLKAPAHANFSGNPDIVLPNTSGNLAVLANAANNRVVTATGTHAMTGESNLTYDGTKLKVSHSSGEISIHPNDGNIEITRTSGGAYIDFKNSTSEDYDIRINEEGGHFRVSSHFRLYDNRALELGNRTSSTFGDLRLFHDASDSFIENHTGVFYIQNAGDLRIRVNNTESAIHCVANGAVELYHNDSKKAETMSNGFYVGNQLSVGESVINLEKSGTHHHRILGNDTGGDLGFQQSSDNGSNTNFTTYLRINDGGNISLPVDDQKLRLGASGDLQIYHSGSHSFISNTTGTLQLENAGNITITKGGTENMARFIPDGAVELYYNNSKKLETTNSGIQVTGQVYTDSAHVNGELDLVGHLDLNSDSHRIKLGAGDDFQFYHDGSNNYIFTNNGDINIQTTGDDIQITAADDIHLNVQGNETAVKCIGNGQVELYYDNGKRFETTSVGIQVTGKVLAKATQEPQIELQDSDSGHTGSAAETGIRFRDGAGTLQSDIGHFDSGSSNFKINTAINADIQFGTNNTSRMIIGASGLIPFTDNSIDLGSSSKRWANLYTADAHFSNVGTGGNDIDGTEGSWTLQEAEDNIYMINKKNGKRYKIKMEEV